MDRAARLLALIESRREPLGISEAARLLEASKSSIRDVLETLRHHQLVERDPTTKRYRLGAGLIGLGQAAQLDRELPDRARPLLAQLAQSTGHSALLLVRHDNEATFIQKVDSPVAAPGLAIPLGWRIPYLAGAAGKVFLAYAPAAERRRVLSQLPRFTERTVTGKQGYELELEATRLRGYAADDQEYMAGVRAVAAPVCGAGDTLMAVILVVGLSIRLHLSDLATFGQQAAATAAELSAAMGWSSAARTAG